MGRRRSGQGDEKSGLSRLARQEEVLIGKYDRDSDVVHSFEQDNHTGCKDV